MSKTTKIVIIVTLAFLLALALAAATAVLIWDRNIYTVSVLPQGAQEVTVEVDTAYRDDGASAQVVGSIFEKEAQVLPVQVSGTVDTTRVGDYVIIYTAQYDRLHFLGNKHATGQAQRTVHVVDTQAPVITLATIPGSYTLPGHPYEDEGFAALDNYDGDITAQVLREEKDGKVSYTVTDSSGNQASAQRDIFYDDPVAPELILEGAERIQLLPDQKFEEPGFQALDNLDGDITASVTVSGEIDYKTPGEYTLEYSVTDSYGNHTSQKRIVQIVRGVIYLTFDDGPSPYTPQLLEVLDKYDVKATFFVVGYKDLSLVAEMAEKGHAIGNHSYTHNYTRLYASKDAFVNEIYRCGTKLKEILGYRPVLFRFPGGSSNSVSATSMKALTNTMVSAGYFYFDWNVDSNDAGGARTTQEVYNNVISGVQKHKKSVVLQHDTLPYSVDAVEAIIKWGLENGYVFAPLDTKAPGAHHKTRN